MVAEDDPGLGFITEPIPTESLVIGTLEEAFAEMDDQIRRERETYRIKGGCTAIVMLFLQSKLYVANAGDCCCIMLTENHDKITELSMDFTPGYKAVMLRNAFKKGGRVSNSECTTVQTFEDN